MSGYPYHPIKIERDEKAGALRYTVTVNLFEEYMRMIDRGIKKQGEKAMDAALEAHGYTKERIVRCRDCRHGHITISGESCKWCDLIATHDINGNEPNNGYDPEPYFDADFFCAWGERREA